jgi:integrase/recombinase XerD
MRVPGGEIEPITGTVVERPARQSIRDVSAARWDEEAALELAVSIWLAARDSPHTKDAYRRDFGAWAAWCKASRAPVADARRADTDAWRGQLAADGLAPATIARRLSAVSSFYSYWLAEEVVTRNPAANAVRPKIAAEPGSISLTRAQASMLLAHIDGLADLRPSVIFRLLAETGMRVGELCSARAGDLAMSGGHHVLAVTRKGGKVQFLPIARTTYERVGAYLDGRADGWLLYVQPTHRRTGDGRMDRSYVRELLRRKARDAGLPREVWERLHPHVLRHSAATLLAADGVPVHEIQQLLGHADLRTTQRYIHHAQSLDASPVYRLAALIAT